MPTNQVQEKDELVNSAVSFSPRRSMPEIKPNHQQILSHIKRNSYQEESSKINVIIVFWRFEQCSSLGTLLKQLQFPHPLIN